MARRFQRLQSPAGDFSSLKVGHYWERERTWDNLPDFHTMPKGNRPCNYYHDVTQTFDQGWHAGASIRTNSTGTTVWLNGFQPQYRLTGSEINSLFRGRLNQFQAFYDSAARQQTDHKLKLLKKIGDLKTNLPVFAAEAAKTSRLIESSAERIVSAYRAFRKGNLKAVAQILHLKPKTVHKNWLEYSYGWIPLLSDVKGQAEFFAQKWALGGRPPRLTVRTSETDEETYQYWTTNHAVYGSSTQMSTRTETISASRRYYLKAWVEFDNPHLASLQQTGLTNPLLVAWELVPYSFVIDWFISVGDWLQAITALHGIRIVRKFENSIVSLKYDYNDPATLAADSDHTYTNGTYHYWVNDRDYVRNPDVSFDVPLNELGVVNPFPAWKKMASSLSLMRARMPDDSGSVRRRIRV